MKKHRGLLKVDNRGIENAPSATDRALAQSERERKDSRDNQGLRLDPALLALAWEEENQEREEIISDTHIRFEDSINSLFKELAKLPAEEQSQALDKLIAYSVEFKEALERPVPPLPEPDSGYEKFPGARFSDPYEWLGEHWGQWLKYFNKHLNRDYLFLDDLGKLDSKLKNALYYRRSSLVNGKNLSVSDIVPTYSDRVNQLLAHSDKEELQKALRLATTLHTRTYRAKDL